MDLVKSWVVENTLVTVTRPSSQNRYSVTPRPRANYSLFSLLKSSSHRHLMSKGNMDNSARLFNCARCRAQVIICSDCDRNNIYCSRRCSVISRKKSQQAAGQRYQNSRRGQLKHADRQRHYRERQKEKVTHHSSPVLPRNDLLLPELYKQAACLAHSVTHDVHCHFCKRFVFVFLRTGFLRHHTRLDEKNLSSWSLGP